MLHTPQLFGRQFAKHFPCRAASVLGYFKTRSQQDRSYSQQNEQPQSKSKNWPVLYLLTGSAAGLGYIYWKKRSTPLHAAEIRAQSANIPAANLIRDPEKVGTFVEGLPTYSLDDLAQHAAMNDRIWVSYKQGVYDITDFVKKHPGGDNILMGAGGSIEPFWELYAVHKLPGILIMLEKYRIGNLRSGEENLALANMEDPWANEPRRHPVLQYRSRKPCNAEPPASLLVETFITPTDVFYVRNHLPVPTVNPDDYELDIVGLGVRDLSLNLQDLKTKFPQVTITAAVQCSGNRRSEMNKVKPVKGLEWTQAAIGNAEWTGVRLRDVLIAAGLNPDDPGIAKHVQFEGLDTDPASQPYGASIPLQKALDPNGDVVLAFEMNGTPLTRDHGFPVRVLVPGVTGARSVKWLTRIVVSQDESSSHWQQNDYRSFSPSVDWDNVDFKSAPSIQEMPVTSAFALPTDGSVLKPKEGKITAKGYAWSGGGRGIVRVDVSANQGKTWHTANLLDVNGADPDQVYAKNWAWTRWTANIPVPKDQDEVELWVKATDSSYSSQPETFEHIWNLRGLLSNAYHKIRVQIET